MSDRLYLGVDGGGTQCRARIRDAAGRLIGEGTGGPANVRLDPALVMKSILDASSEAARSGGLTERDLARAHAGFALAGAAQTADRQRLLKEPNPFASIRIETDAYGAWLGAFAGADGAILILGTGSCGLAVVGGKQSYVSGWGAEVGDEASGQMLGREAIRRTLWAHDGRAAHTLLTRAVLKHFDGSAEKIVDFSSRALPADFGRFVPLVLEHTAACDPVALSLIKQAAADAALMVSRLLAVGAPSVCLLGGLAAPLTPWLSEELQEKLSAPQADAMDGAILMVQHAAEKLSA